MRTPSRLASGWIVAVASVCALGVSAALLVLTLSDGDVSDQTDETTDLVQARITLEAASVEVVALRMLDAIGEGSDPDRRLEVAAAKVRQAGAEIAALADGDGPVADEARALLDDAGSDVLDAPGDADLGDLFYVAEDASRYTGRSGIIRTRLDAIHQAAFLQALPMHVVVEAIAADVAVTDRPVDPSTQEFMDAIIFIVRTEGGWFGADPDAPLDDSVWIEVEESWEMLPTEMERMEQLFVENPLVTHDAWLRELGDASTEPPLDLSTVVGLADGLDDDVAVVIDELVAAEAGDPPASGDRWGFVLFAAVGLVALVGLVWGARTIARTARSSRALAAIARRDALTGVGNRHELDHRTRSLASDPRFDHHLVAMIDLDSFKMVNDMNGHAAGDAVLVEVARSLERVVADSSVGRSRVEHSVIRLGGDEFLVTLHGSEPFDTDAFQSRLDAVRNTTIEHVGDRLALDFSLGVTQSQGPSDLSDLMHRVDLAVYADKASRSSACQVASADAAAGDSESVGSVSDESSGRTGEWGPSSGTA